MRIFIKTLFIIMVAATPADASARLKVITTLPDLAEAARVIGGDHAEVDSLLEGTEDAHFLDAVPTFIRKVANADIVCVIGLELEVGWMPKILSKSANSKVQPGGIGYCETGSFINALDKATGPVDRSMGDVHPAGNPHFTLDPKTLAVGARGILEALVRAKPDASETFHSNYRSLQEQMSSLHSAIDNKLKPLQNTNQLAFVEYHKDFTYFFNSYNLKSLGAIEEKPGVPPSAARLAIFSKTAKTNQVRMALGALHSPEKHLRRFSELSGIPFKKLPTMVQPKNKNLDSIEKVQHFIADSILK
jgi:zinc/manganese transport system substrate-binding protein